MVEEPLVQQVMEMGFDRSEIVRAANALRSNDAGEVTGFLLEGGEMYGEGIEFVLDDEMDETAAAAAAVTAAAAGGDANPSLLAGSTVEANTTAENQALDSHVPASSLNDGDTAARATGGGDRGSNSAASLGGDERTRALTEAAKIAPPPQNLRWVVKIAPSQEQRALALLNLSPRAIFSAFSEPLLSTSQEEVEEEDMEEEEEEVERENENEDQDVMGVVKRKAGAGKFNPLPLQTEVTTKDVALAFSSDKPKLLKLSSNFASDFVDIAIAVLSQGGGKNAPTLTLIKEFQSVPVDMCPREMVGAMVVQAALGSLAQQHPAGINKCPDWLVKVVFLTKVVDRATACLNELIEHYLGGSGEFSGRVLKSYYKLYGMLHAIMLILFNRVGLPSSSPRHFSCDGHQMIFLYLADENFLHFFALLVDLLRRQDRLPLPENELEDKNENKEANGQGSVPAVDENDAINATLWVAPALLVLDAMSQPLLVGHTQLSTDVLEMQKYLSEHKHPLGKRNCEECTMALARIKSKFNVGHGKQGDWRAQRSRTIRLCVCFDFRGAFATFLEQLRPQHF